MDYTKPIKAFQRYMQSICEDDSHVDSEHCYQICKQLLGCTERMPAWLWDELQEHEGIAEKAETYHDAAVEMLTEHFLEDDDYPESTVRLLYPVFVKVGEVNGTEATKAGFAAWLGTMLHEDDVAEAMAYWTEA